MNRNVLLAAVAIIVVAIAGTAIYVMASPPKVKEIRLELQEFGYNGAKSGPTLTIKAGETYRLTLVNKGAIDHEFRLAKDKEAFLSDTKSAIAKLQSQGIKDVAGLEAASAFKESRRLTGIQAVKIGQEFDWDADVDVGETKTVELVINTPGTYWYVCGEPDGTFPLLHAHQGMVGQLVVQP
ncbi:MAG: cupredoxin domain-containing protein [Thaumarchaeota archaeon]|nr:cupredoxin domain-containing protein [Nitrososphaerota archaeon]